MMYGSIEIEEIQSYKSKQSCINKWLEILLFVIGNSLLSLIIFYLNIKFQIEVYLRNHHNSTVQLSYIFIYYVIETLFNYISYMIPYGIIFPKIKYHAHLLVFVVLFIIRFCLYYTE